jgi:trehalose/maltose hydrolase-like predicted phosphorylase
MRDQLDPTINPLWIFEEHGYDPAREIDIESRFATSNGFLGVRGARTASRGPMWVSWIHSLSSASWPRTYVAGLFDTPNIEPPVPALIPALDWLRIRIRLNGRPVLLRSRDMLLHRRVLDMRRGAMVIDWHQRDPNGTVIRVRTLRVVSQADRAIGLQLATLQVDRPHIEVTFEALFGQADFGLELEHFEPNFGVWRTEQSGKHLAVAAVTALQRNNVDQPYSSVGPLRRSWTWISNPGETVHFQRLVAIARSDSRQEDAVGTARSALARAQGLGWRGVLEAHETAWSERWRCSDVEIEGDEQAQRSIRFAIYHLVSAANPSDERVSIGARALTGDSYLGHVFWDTEIYLLPFFTLTWPEAARSLLMYRYHTLDAARAKAKRMGWRGALYAWESADTGEETTPDQIMGPDGRPVDVLCGRHEHHISAAVAYAVWQYWYATEDSDFLRAAGAEMLLETARFWASCATASAEGDYHIRDVIGPDEYHERIDDNAYTNLMARWNIRCALETATLFHERWPDEWAKLSKRISLDEEELRIWRNVADRLTVRYDPVTRILEQFEGYFALEDVDRSEYAGRATSVEGAIGRERMKRSKLLKQADVVALLALIPGEFDRDTTSANFIYYEPRCTHESSLSRPMHGLVAARIGQMDTALRYFREAAATDLAGAPGSSAGGVRIAALGGLWQAAVLGFAGLKLRDDGLALTPRLPREWESLGFHIQWRGRQLAFRIEERGQALTASLHAGAPVKLFIGDHPHELAPGQQLRIPVTEHR